MAIHFIVPNFEPRLRRWEVPKFHRIAMVESIDGFALTPFYSAPENCEICIAQALIEKGNHPFVEAFRGQWCWEVLVYEFDGEKRGDKPAWEVIFDPDSTKEYAREQAEKIKYQYENSEEIEQLSQSFRFKEPRISLPPRKPNLDHKDTPVHEYEAAWGLYEILLEQRSARFQVLKSVYPRTADLVEKHEKATNEEVRERLEQESVEAFCAENAGGWSDQIFKAWQKLNPIGRKWAEWIYIWRSKQARRSARINPVDYELAFNWTFKKYHSLTAKELAEAVFETTGQRLTAEAIKKRRSHLGLKTTRPPGPRPTS